MQPHSTTRATQRITRAERRVRREAEKARKLQAEIDMVSRFPTVRQLSLLVYIAGYEESITRTTYKAIRLMEDGDRAGIALLHAREIIAHTDAERAALYDGVPGWQKLKALIYLRDSGCCRACGKPVAGEDCHLGHLVDKMLGGLDLPNNLVLMCRQCNMCKPLHATIAEALAWCDAGGWPAEVMQAYSADREARRQALELLSSV